MAADLSSTTVLAATFWEVTTLLVILLVFGLALIGLGLVGTHIATKKRADAVEIRGLGLPRGSVRALLALLIVASFIIFLFAGNLLIVDDAQHQAMLTVVVGLVGTVTGYYFGARTGQSLETPTDPSGQDADTDGTSEGDGPAGTDAASTADQSRDAASEAEPAGAAEPVVSDPEVVEDDTAEPLEAEASDDQDSHPTIEVVDEHLAIEAAVALGEGTTDE